MGYVVALRSGHPWSDKQIIPCSGGSCSIYCGTTSYCLGMILPCLHWQISHTTRVVIRHHSSIHKSASIGSPRTSDIFHTIGTPRLPLHAAAHWTSLCINWMIFTDSKAAHATLEPTNTRSSHATFAFKIQQRWPPQHSLATQSLCQRVPGHCGIQDILYGHFPASMGQQSEMVYLIPLSKSDVRNILFDACRTTCRNI